MTANPAAVGTHKGDTFKTHEHTQRGAGESSAGNDFWRQYGGGISTAASTTGATGSAETAPMHTRVAPVILI